MSGLLEMMLCQDQIIDIEQETKLLDAGIDELDKFITCFQNDVKIDQNESEKEPIPQ